METIFSSVALKKYRYIFIVDDRSYWESCKTLCRPEVDVVFTYDLGVKKALEAEGIRVFFTDHLVDAKIMQKNNFLVYTFFEQWHYDAKENDILRYKGIPFGFSLRLEFWNDYIAYVRSYINLKALVKIQYEKIYVGSNDSNIYDILNILDKDFENLMSVPTQGKSFYFPIAQWMDQQIRPSGLRGLKYKAREYATFMQIKCMEIYDFIARNKAKPKVFVQEYHPTRKLVTLLKKNTTIQVILTHMEKRSNIGEYLYERYIPIWRNDKKYASVADDLMKELKKRKYTQLLLADGDDISVQVYDIIFKRIAHRLSHTLCTLDACIQYVKNNKLDLVVLIANMGHIPTLLHCVTQQKDIPSYLIINGLLGPEYSDEAKYATIINAYSESIKKHYFRRMDNIVTLGDPRMDRYTDNRKKLKLNRKEPTIVIGASGFNSVELNSYVAVEFDFMYDVLMGMKQIKASGQKIKVILKIRPNGYKKQYEDFVQEYFEGIVDSIEDVIPMEQVLEKADFYISIYSQTLFEASCLGVPVVYYKKDTEMMDTPFDGKSELVTVDNTEELIQAFYDFTTNPTRYDAFLDRKIMEKYVGSLDGNNTQRNLDYIYTLLEKKD